MVLNVVNTVNNALRNNAGPSWKTDNSDRHKEGVGKH